MKRKERSGEERKKCMKLDREKGRDRAKENIKFRQGRIQDLGGEGGLPTPHPSRISEKGVKNGEKWGKEGEY